MHSDTIFAVSSGAPPAGIAVLRISGPRAAEALSAMAGPLPAPRRASLRDLRHPIYGQLLDRALILWFPGPRTATGEDLGEIHAHGGRAVVRAIEDALGAIAGVRRALPGEFTRRALDNGRIDLAEAEGLGDLLSAETEGQRRAALAMSGGALSRLVLAWQERLLALSAGVEAILDFSDEEDVDADAATVQRLAAGMAALANEWRRARELPPVERLHDGISVAIAGPPNAGKSTLINALAQREAAIVSPLAGTTRDIIEVPLALEGIAFRFADTAGLHAGTGDVIEAMGMERARVWAAGADMLLWLGLPEEAPDHACRCLIAAQADRAAEQEDWATRSSGADITLSAVTGEGMDVLNQWLISRARDLIPHEGDVALNRRQRDVLARAEECFAAQETDLLLIAEQLRHARNALSSITGGAGTEAMLDALFGRFCIGK